MQKNNALRVAIVAVMTFVLGAPSSFAAGAPKLPQQTHEQPKKKEQKPGKVTPQSKAGQPAGKTGSQSPKKSGVPQQ